MKRIISLVLVLALGPSVEVANADFTFGEPTNLGPIINGPDDVVGVSVARSGLELYFASDRAGGYGSYDLWVATRTTADDEWAAPMNLGPTANSQYPCMAPSISADGLELLFSDLEDGPYLPGGVGSTDAWLVTRETIHDAWGAPINLGGTVNYHGGDICPNMSADGLSLYFASGAARGGSGLYDLWVATRASVSDPWSEPVNLGPAVNSSAAEFSPSLSTDGLTLFFCSTPLQADYDLWMTMRATKDDAWGLSVRLAAPVNTSDAESFPSISADGSTLYFCSDRSGGSGQNDIWQLPIVPIVDLNGDGIVDSADMCIMVDHWGTDEPLCDIGPMPWGDGIVDVQDLIVLAEHLFEEPGLIAYWKLDETEGDIASDSSNDNDGTVYGDPAWQPEIGMVDGALELDGIDDYVNTPFVLNPADGNFSVFAWIKGGAPGQAVLSQIGGVNWLCADLLEGNLMTELKGTGRGTALMSNFVITDGLWHRIGLVSNGSNRTLYVDDVAVAEDAQTNLEASDNGLYIGTGKAMEPGSFFSGLIDDVRIYNRAVRP